MIKGADKSDRILWIIYTPCLLALVFVIFAYKTGALTKAIYEFYGTLALMPVFLSLFIYSLVTGRTRIIGRKKIEKEQTPGLYFLITSIWGLIALIAIIYLIIKK